MSQLLAARRWVVAIAFFLGAMVGTTMAGYLLYAWLPPTLILRDAPPSYLKFDPQGLSPHYRDVYVVSVARRFVEIGGDDLALQEALGLLGVSTGDVAFDEALAMVRSTIPVVEREVANGRRFTLGDAASLQSLLSALERASPPAVAPTHPRRGVQGIGAVLVVLVVAAAVVALWFFQRNAAPLPAAATSTRASADAERITPPPSPAPAVAMSAAPTIAMPLHEEQPRASRSVPSAHALQHFTCTYVHGDETFAETFDVLAEDGEMVGECTVEIGDRFGFASPSQVIALSVGLFEKSAMRSVTRSLLTPFAFRNPAIFGKMSAIGEPVLAAPGAVFDLHVNHLYAEVTVGEVHFGRLDGAAEGYFERVTLEIRVFRRA